MLERLNHPEMKQVDDYLDYVASQRVGDINMSDIANCVAILLPDLNVRDIRAAVVNTFYLLLYTVYFRKRSINLPFIGKFMAFWRPSAQTISRGVYGHQGEAMPVVRRGRWVFKLKSRLMSHEFYEQFLAIHKKDAKELEGVEHPTTSLEVFRAFKKAWGADPDNEEKGEADLNNMNFLLDYVAKKKEVRDKMLAELPSIEKVARKEKKEQKMTIDKEMELWDNTPIKQLEVEDERTDILGQGR